MSLAVGATAGPQAGLAQEAPAAARDADALAKALSNPVAALISVPLQLNYDSGYGADGNGERWQLNVQPVVPISLNQDWNVISRTILPILHQSDVVGNGSDSGIGDVTQSLFFSPKKPTASEWIWGIGPAFLLPTASEDVLGTEQWAIGPTAVVLKQTASGLTYGALVNYLVSVAGDENRADVNSAFIQPFLAKGLGKGRTATIKSRKHLRLRGACLECSSQPDVLAGHEDRRPDGELRGRRARLPRDAARRPGLGRAVRGDSPLSEVRAEFSRLQT